MPTVTLVGDRQEGKTHALLAIGNADAVRGANVLYLAGQHPAAIDAFDRYVRDFAQRHTFQRVSRRNGRESVRHTSGGTIRSTSVGRETARTFFGDPTGIDTLLLDDGANGYDQYGVDYRDCIGWPDIRVYRTSL